MAQAQWCYENDGKQFGPVPWEHLRALVSVGELAGSDKVWRSGEEPGESHRQTLTANEAIALAAGGSAEAAANGASTAVAVKDSVAGNGASGFSLLEGASRSRQWLREKFDALAEDAKAAARLASCEAGRVRINNVTLPSLYLRLGQAVRREDKFRDDFPDAHEKLDKLARQMSHLRDAPQGEDEFGSLTTRATQLAAKVAAVPRLELLAADARGALRELGRQAFEKHGQQAGPETLTREIGDTLSKLRELNEEIEQLAQAEGKNTLGPRSLTASGIAALAATGSYLASFTRRK